MAMDMGREGQLDFSGVTLEPGQSLHIGNYSYTAPKSLKGVDLAHALYENLVDRGPYAFTQVSEWTVKYRPGTASLFLVTDNNRTIDVTSPVIKQGNRVMETQGILASQPSPGGGYNPNLSQIFRVPISFSDKVLEPGEELYIGDYTFENTTDDELSGKNLVQAVEADMLLPANALAVDGVVEWVPRYVELGNGTLWLYLSADGIDVSYTSPNAMQKLDVVQIVMGGAEGASTVDPSEEYFGSNLVELTSGLYDLDIITDFQIGQDKITIPNGEILYLVVSDNTLYTVDYQGFRYVCLQGLSYSVGAHEAGLFFLNGDHYLLVNDGNPSFDPNTDIVIKLVNLQGHREDLLVEDIFM
jgi:hypothetical protein